MKNNNKLLNIIIAPLCIWAGLSLISAKYNIAQGDLKSHNWILMNAATGLLTLFWSVKAGVHYMEKLTLETSSWGTITLFISGLFGSIGSLIYLLLLVIDLINK